MRKILVIDDDRNMRELYRCLLGSEYQVIPAKNGSEGLKLAQEHIPELIVLDFSLPDISGLEVLSILQKHELLKNIPVLLISGHCWEYLQAEHPTDFYSKNFIQKPFNPFDVKAKIENHLSAIA